MRKPYQLPGEMIFKTSQSVAKSIHSKLLFFVKNKGQWNAKSGPKVGDGKVTL